MQLNGVNILTGNFNVPEIFHLCNMFTLLGAQTCVLPMCTLSSNDQNHRPILTVSLIITCFT